MKKLSEIVIKNKWIVIASVILITVFLGLQIPKVRINSDVVSSLPATDEDAVLLKKVGDKFGGNRMGMVILEAENVFTTEVLQHVKQVTDSIRQTEGVSSVTSLTNAMEIKETEEGVEVGRLVDEDNLPETPEDMAKLKERAMSNEMYKGAIVSEDGTATIVIFTLFDTADIQKIADEVKQKTAAMNLPEKIYYAGSPMLITSISKLISTDLKMLFPIALLVIAAVLLISFRSFKGMALPLLVCFISIIWVIGIMGLAGFEMTMVSNNIPIVLLAVGNAYAIHVLHRIKQLYNSRAKDAIALAVSSVAIPVLLAALTTMAGFLSFIFGSYLRMIRDFGLFTALGTFFALLLSLYFIPAVVSVFPGKTFRSNKENFKKESRSWKYMLEPLHHLLLRYPKRILLSWILLAVIGFFGIAIIQRNVDIKNYFKKNNPARIAEDLMTRKFGGTKPVFVYFRGDVQSPELLKTMMKMEEYMKQSPDIITTQSIAGLVADLNKAFGKERQIPDEKDMIEQLWFMIDGNENLKKFVSDDLTEAVIISKFISSDNNAKIAFKEYIRKFIDENSTETCHIEVTGMPFIDVTMDRSLINSQFWSVLIAIIFVIIIVGSILRSAKLGIFASIPIFAAIIMLFGFMGFAGIPLNIATVLVASIAVGIGIDYSIHVISHFKNALEKSGNISVALEKMLLVSGNAIIINVLSVSAGFLVLLFSEMVPLEYFGLLISLSMIASGLGALTLLPAILILTNKQK